jgi:hypothetical protein
MTLVLGKRKSGDGAVLFGGTPEAGLRDCFPRIKSGGSNAGLWVLQTIFNYISSE